MDTNFKKIKKLPVLIISIFVFIYAIISININNQTIPVNSIQDIKVIPGGGLAGIKMYVEGVLVVGYSDVVGTDNNVYMPAKSTNIKPGDRIIQVNNIMIKNSNDLSNNIMVYDGNPIKIVYVRDKSTFEEYITPVLSRDDHLYHIGLWIKDGAIGIGTISFYNKNNDKYAALGHGITDMDTGQLIEINDGDIIKTDIISIRKGKNSTPGQIKGIFLEDTNYGDINCNSTTGIYGNYTTINTLDKYLEGINVTPINEIKTGQATILCTIDNDIKEYEVKIKKIYKVGNKDNKNMIIEVTDKELLEKTGGIIQGMSGSPIIQNNKLVGILTHVFVNDPTQGYAIFAQTMIEVINSME